MYDDLNALSPEEKIRRYQQLNNTPTDSSYLTYSPIPTSIQPPPIAARQSSAPQSFPSIDFSSMVQSQLPSSSFLKPKDIPTTPDDVGDKTNNTKINNMVENTPKNVSGTPTTPSTVTHKPIAANDAAKQAYNYYITQKGIPANAAAGIVGNLYQESGVDPTRSQNGGGPGRGVAQWTNTDRWQGFQRWATANKRDPNDLHSQLDYILVEPGYEGALKKTMAAKTPSEAAMTFGKYFEAPKDSEARWDVRQGVAENLASGK